MTETSYFQWLCDTVRSDQNDKSYYNLLGMMYETPFEVKIDNDINRAVDGNEFKSAYILDIYGTEAPKDADLYFRPEQNCSILEMIMGISKRMAFELAEDESEDFDFYRYFWEIIENLGLKRYDDDQFGDNFIRCKIEIREILNKLNERKYKKSGEGGMFPLYRPQKNQKKVEIWYQMQAYINEQYMISEFDE